MKFHRLTEEYARAFRAFLDHTNEKSALLLALKENIATIGARSLLDIGAGNGDLAIPLSKLVSAYVAIEPNSDHVAKLQASGLDVIAAAFPVQIPQIFDIILASHVVPWEMEESEIFFNAAWQLLGDSGVFIMITYDEEVGAWNELLIISGLPIETVGQGHFEGYKQFLSNLGELKIQPVITYVEAVRLDDMLLALSFVYSDGKPEMAQRFQENEIIKNILESKYYSNGSYRFPFTHYLLQAKKR